MITSLLLPERTYIATLLCVGQGWGALALVDWALRWLRDIWLAESRTCGHPVHELFAIQAHKPSGVLFLTGSVLAMAMAASTTAEIQKICSRSNVPQEIIDFLIAAHPDGLGMQSLSDFANYFTEGEAKYEAEIQHKILDRTAEGDIEFSQYSAYPIFFLTPLYLPWRSKICNPAEGKFKDDALVRARIRTAWKLAKAEFDKACSRLVEEDVPVDYDAPLSKEEEADRAKSFDDAYDHLQLESENTPMRGLVARCLREFRSAERHVSLTDTTRIRSEAGPSRKCSKLCIVFRYMRNFNTYYFRLGVVRGTVEAAPGQGRGQLYHPRSSCQASCGRRSFP